MIDRKLIEKAVETKNCIGIKLAKYEAFTEWDCGEKCRDGYRDLCIGLRPRANRIMKQWLEDNKEKQDE
jgi:hypothetical protein